MLVSFKKFARNLNFNSFFTFPANSKFDDARRKREEKKLQRQREMEARRAARAGPMKLGVGAKKL